MGAGASIPDDHGARGDAGASANYALYLQAERLSKNGYFHTHQVEYENALRDAIEKEALDIVELLLISGNARIMDTGPVLIAAELGKLDVLELLDSAGYDLHKADSQGNTAMMYAARDKRSMSCANVGAFLALRGGKKLCRARNTYGSTCMHVAAENNNAAFVEAVLSCIGNIKSIKEYIAMPNFDKKTALDIAERKGKSHTETSMTFHQFITCGKPAQKSGPSHHPPVDPERMMAVWEAFFENAMKRMMSKEMAVDGGLMLDDSGYIKAAGAVLGAPDFAESVSSTASSPSYSHVTYNERDFNKIESLLVAWFEWIMLHYTDEMSGNEMHYLVNKLDGRTVWLTDHLRENCVAEGGLVAAADFTQLTGSQRQEVGVIPQGPGGMRVTDCVRNGWLQYFDALSNSLLWLNAFTWICKETLPLGMDPTIRVTKLPLITSGLSDYFNGKDVAPDPAVSAAWVMVVYEEEEEDEEETKAESKNSYFPTKKATKEDPLASGGVWDIWDESGEGMYLHHKQRGGGGEGAGSHACTDVPVGVRTGKANPDVEDVSERTLYYWNRITGSTTYTKPANYDLINEVHNGGWALVCSEASGWIQYWFHEKTGESRWA